VALAFRHRIFVWLVVIATVPATIAVTVAVFSPDLAAPVGGVEAWERAGDTWRGAQRSLDRRALPAAARAALERHDTELSVSIRRARQAQAFRYAIAGALAGLVAALAVLVTGGAVRLAGHLSRQLSRPIDELLDWTRRLGRGEPLPERGEARGAPEFQLLRDAFRGMAQELDAARAREIEAAQLRTFRDIARQVAHELKNPLTPLRFAVGRLRQQAEPTQAELLDVLDSESQRIEQMARDFASLGRLPEGPPSPVDLGELLDGLAAACVPAGLACLVRRPDGVPLVLGHYEPLRRAFQNLLLNAVDAIQGTGAPAPGDGPAILVSIAAADIAGRPAVRVVIADRGPGLPAEAAARVFEPYFTTKTRGTGLGLAIVRQTVLDHGGTIVAGDAPGGGAAFTVTLPVERP